MEKKEKNKIKPKSLKEFMELAAKMPPEELEERLDMWSGYRMYWKGLPFPTDNLNITQMVIAPINEGAAHHCLPENPALASQVAFDWLDEVFQ